MNISSNMTGRTAFRLAEGDTILVLGDPANLETLESEAGAK
jgi:hypothetical protein